MEYLRVVLDRQGQTSTCSNGVEAFSDSQITLLVFSPFFRSLFSCVFSVSIK